MSERRRGTELRATAVDRMRSLIALSLALTHNSPAGELDWQRNIREQSVTLATGILMSPKEEIIAAQYVLAKRIASTRNAFVGVALEGIVREAFAQAGLSILRKKRKITKAKAEYGKNK